MYFALPARTSAVQIDGRLVRALKRLFGDLAPAVFLAVPGYLKVNEADGKRLPGFQTPLVGLPRPAALGRPNMPSAT